MKNLQITPEQIIDLVSVEYNVELHELFGRCFKSYISTPRQLCVYLIFAYTRWETKTIADYFARPEYNIINMIDTIRKNIKSDFEFKCKVHELRSVVQNMEVLKATA